MCEPMKPAAPEMTYRKHPPSRHDTVVAVTLLSDAESHLGRDGHLSDCRRHVAVSLLAQIQLPSCERSAVRNADPGFVWGRSAPVFETSSGKWLLQGKVIRERPLPGLAHAFVFWGFLAFALVTIDHMRAGFGLDLLSPDSSFGRFYFGFAASFAVAVIVSIVGLQFGAFWSGRAGSDPSRRNPASSPH